jgi:hypothetical protein
LQLFGSVLNKIVDDLEQQQRHQDDAVPVDGVAAIGISEGVESIDVAAPSEPPPSSSAAHAACNIVSLLQSLYESMATIPDSSSVCTDFISAFLFGCISRINWSSSPSSSPLSSSPGRCAVITAAQPLLQVKLHYRHVHAHYMISARFGLTSSFHHAVACSPYSH